MLIGLISDTHDHVPHIERAVEIFREREAELVLHAGDYCSPFTIPPFEGLTLKGIFGNNDGDKRLLISKFNEIGALLNGEFLAVEADTLRIGLYHGTHEEITASLVESGHFDVVVSGHTHETVNRMAGNTLALNPGTAHGFGGKATICLLDSETGKVEFVRLN